MTKTTSTRKLFFPMQKILLFLILTLFLQPKAFGAALLLAEKPTLLPAPLLQTLEFIATQQGMVIDIQRELVARPAINPDQGGEGEAQKAKWIATWLRDHNFSVETLDFPDERVPGKIRPNLIAVFPKNAQKTGNERTLWLLAHMDVAAPGPRELWSSDPFALRVDGDTLYGRGVEDNNQAITVAMLLANSLQKQNIAPPMRLGVVLISGALTNFSVGIYHIFARKPDIFSPQDLLVLMDYGNPEGSEIGTAEKGKFWAKVEIKGKEGHAAAPQKAINSFAAGALLITRFRELTTLFPDTNPLFNPPFSTFTPTITDNHLPQGLGPNHISPAFTFYVDVRVLPGHTLEDVTESMRNIADVVEHEEGVRIALSWTKETSTEAYATPKEAPVLQGLSRAIQAELGVTPQFIGTSGVTTAARVRARNVPIAVWGIQSVNRNAADENASITAHLKQTMVLARMLFDPALLKYPLSEMAANVQTTQKKP